MLYAQAGRRWLDLHARTTGRVAPTVQPRPGTAEASHLPRAVAALTGAARGQQIGLRVAGVLGGAPLRAACAQATVIVAAISISANPAPLLAEQVGSKVGLALSNAAVVRVDVEARSAAYLLGVLPRSASGGAVRVNRQSRPQNAPYG